MAQRPPSQQKHWALHDRGACDLYDCDKQHGSSGRALSLLPGLSSTALACTQKHGATWPLLSRARLSHPLLPYVQDCTPEALLVPVCWQAGKFHSGPTQPAAVPRRQTPSEGLSETPLHRNPSCSPAWKTRQHPVLAMAACELQTGF